MSIIARLFSISLRLASVLALFALTNVTVLAIESGSDKNTTTKSLKSPEDFRQNADREFVAGYYQSARDYYGQYLHRVTTSEPDLIARMAVCDFWLGIQDLSSKEFEEASKLYGQTLSGYLAQTDSHLAKLAYDQSLASALECCKRFPGEWKSYWRLGFFHNRYCEYQEAIEAYSKAIERFPHSDTRSNAVEFEELCGMPTLARLYGLRSQCFYRTGKYPETLADCTKYIELEPKSPLGYEARAQTYVQLQKFEIAVPDLKMAVSINSGHPRTFKQLGFCQLQLGQYQEALTNLSQAIKLFPRYAEAYHLRAQALKNLGKDKDAADDERTAKRMGYQSQPAV